MTVISSSSTIQYIDDSTTSTSATSYILVKEFTVTDSYSGSWKIVFDVSGDYDSTTGYAKIYKNGSAIGTDRSATGYQSYITYSQDFTGINISNGDRIQIYAYTPDGSGDPTLNSPYCSGAYYCVYVRNFRIEYSLPGGSLGGAALSSYPSGARIWIDGVDKGVNTPDTIANLSATTHSYTLKLAGYADATGSFSVATATTTVVPTVTMSTASTGNASFTSTPSGATIWIDGSNTGLTTPNTVTSLSAGGHNYSLKLIGYADATSPFSVTGGSTTTVPTVTFSPSAYITSTPSVARIWIDGADQGVYTPATITGLTAGSRTFRLVLSGYSDVTGNFTATSGSTVNVPVTFSPSAIFATTPSGASIYLDGSGTSSGTTPSTITGLTAGSHSYKLFRAGYNAVTGSFNAVAGTTTTIPTILLSGTAMAFLSAGD